MDLVAGAVPGVGEVAVTGGVRVADELDLPVARGGRGQDGAARRGDEAAELAGGPGALGALDEPHAVLAAGEAADPVGGPAGGHQGGDRRAVDLDVVVGGGVVEHDADPGAPEAAFEVDAGPAVLGGARGNGDPARGVRAGQHAGRGHRGGADRAGSSAGTQAVPGSSATASNAAVARTPRMFFIPSGSAQRAGDRGRRVGAGPGGQEAEAGGCRRRARLPFQLRLRAVTAAPLWLTVAFHAWVICWPLAKVNVAVHAEVAGGRAVASRSTSPWKPPVHCEMTRRSRCSRRRSAGWSAGWSAAPSWGVRWSARRSVRGGIDAAEHLRERPGTSGRPSSGSRRRSGVRRRRCRWPC